MVGKYTRKRYRTKVSKWWKRVTKYTKRDDGQGGVNGLVWYGGQVWVNALRWSWHGEGPLQQAYPFQCLQCKSA